MQYKDEIERLYWSDLQSGEGLSILKLIIQNSCFY